MSPIFFATANPKKVKEIQQIIGSEFSIQSFLDLQDIPDVPETEITLEGNAILKAKAGFALTNQPCFADDTGLEVEALNGAPGVFSARFAGEPSNPVKNMQKLLLEMKTCENRVAKFRTVIAWFDGKEIQLFEGELKGKIGFEPIGNNGFGYDPIFIPHGQSLTLAEYSSDLKNLISHRGIAIRKFVGFLKQV